MMRSDHPLAGLATVSAGTVMSYLRVLDGGAPAERCLEPESVRCESQMIALTALGTTEPESLFMAISGSLPRSPQRALLHPVWLGSLGVLALNDHVLKGASVLPSVITGKASDFAGMLVAPLLLVVLLRARSQRSWGIAHAAVGVVFAAIQLSAPLAAAWGAVMEGVGFPWVITRDPTDLIALPMLLVSWHWLGLAQQRPAVRNAGRAAHAGAATAGLFACVATSSPEPIEDWEEEPPIDQGPQDPVFEDISADVFVHNGLAESVVIRIRTLKPEVDLDCNIISRDPATLLTSPLFDVAQTWTLPPTTNQAIGGVTGSRDCRAALVEVDGLPPTLLMWMLGDPAVHTVPGAGQLPEDPGQLELVPLPDGGVGWSGAEDLRYTPATAEPMCAEQLDAHRLAWSEPLPSGAWHVDGIEPGFDGCFELQLTAGETTQPWFVCVPAETMTIVAGQDVTIDHLNNGAGFLMTATEEGVPVQPAHSLMAFAGLDEPVVDGLTFGIVPDFDCDAEVQPACGTVASPVHLVVSGESFDAAQLRPGDAVTTLADEREQYNLALVHGQDRGAVDPACAQGPDGATYDVEFVLGIAPVPTR